MNPLTSPLDVADRRRLPPPTARVRWRDAPAEEKMLDPAVHVLIAYDDFVACDRANRAVAALVAEAGGSPDVHPRFWRFDSLAEPVARVRALTEAVRADLIVVAPAGSAELPGKVARWLKWTLAAKDGGGTMVMVTADDGGGVDAGLHDDLAHFLRDLAGRADMSFVAVADTWEAQGTAAQRGQGLERRPSRCGSR